MSNNVKKDMRKKKLIRAIVNGKIISLKIGDRSIFLNVKDGVRLANAISKAMVLASNNIGGMRVANIVEPNLEALAEKCLEI